jgi:hypothetical protein
VAGHAAKQEKRQMEAEGDMRKKNSERLQERMHY